MTLFTLDELARGGVLVTFGGLAGLTASVWAPGSALWLLPAAGAVAGGALTVPEVRDELRRALPVARPLLEGPRKVGQWVRTGEWGAGRPVLPQPAQPRTVATADPLFAALDEEPHRMIIGHTRGGKSTAMHAMTSAWAGQGYPVIVCDPDAAHGQWPGCTVAGFNEDYAGIGRALKGVADEFRKRSTLYADGQRDFAPLHLVIDEAHAVFAEVEGARKAVDQFARRGAKRGIFLTVGTQDNHVDSLGLDSAAVLQNFITAELRKDGEGRRVATVYRGNAARQRDARQFVVPALPDPRGYIRPKETPQPAPRPAADVLAAFLAEPVPARPDAGERPAVPVPSTAGNGNAHSSVTVGTGTGGLTQVNVTQVAPGPRTTSTGRRPRGVDVRERRLLAAYRKAGADGVPFSKVWEQHKGTKTVVFKAWQEGKATRKGAA